MNLRNGLLACLLTAALVTLVAPTPAQERIAAPKVAQPTLVDDGWPRKVAAPEGTVTIFQPQLEKWEGNILQASAAFSFETKAAALPVFGVLQLTARTEVDREQQVVGLDDFKVAKVTLVAAADKEKDVLTILNALAKPGAKVVALERLQASLAVTAAESAVAKPQLKNEPPKIIFSVKPTMLVLVDGKPALRQVQGSKLLRAINTRSLMLFDETAGKYYLHLVQRWAVSDKVDGEWKFIEKPPAVLEEVKKTLADNPAVDLLNNPASDVKEALDNGTMPLVHVSTTPTELVETHGEPHYGLINGTQLLYVKNTSAEIIMDLNAMQYYVLLSGRWFRTKSISSGPWEFVAGDKLPADFAKIPENHPKGEALSSVSGTRQAREAVIANRIPQTATIRRAEARLEPKFDGEPQFAPIQGTKLNYAVNSPTPIIQVTPQLYFAIENGIWFTATDPNGPWSAATSVAPDIYTIPPSSPLHYVTNAYVYGSTPDLVYGGYTPGYFGANVAPWGTVVYGTGYQHSPWLGGSWFGNPWTYGYGAAFRWDPFSGWNYGFGAAVGRPWWGPVGWNAGYSGGPWRDGWQSGWGGPYANLHPSRVYLNNFNAYNRWQPRVFANQNANVLAQMGGPGFVPGNARIARQGTLSNMTPASVSGTSLRQVSGVQPRATVGNTATVNRLQIGAPTVSHFNQQTALPRLGAVSPQAARGAGGVVRSTHVPTGGGVRGGAVAGAHAGGGGRRR